MGYLGMPLKLAEALLSQRKFPASSRESPSVSKNATPSFEHQRYTVAPNQALPRDSETTSAPARRRRPATAGGRARPTFVTTRGHKRPRPFPRARIKLTAQARA